jgi:CDP-diacylglycerol--serine O-phosphatidyltransferase
LADFLNFCIAPALILYEWVFRDFYFYGWLVTLIYLTAGAYRLARFNVMYSQGAENVSSNYFIGMPSPAGAIMVFAPIILTLQEHIDASHVEYKALYVAAIAFLMASTIRTPSLKNMSLPKKYRKYAAMLTLAIAGVFILQPVTSYFVCICLYGLSIIYVNYKRQRTKKLKNKI